MNKRQLKKKKKEPKRIVDRSISRAKLSSVATREFSILNDPGISQTIIGKTMESFQEFTDRMLAKCHAEISLPLIISEPPPKRPLFIIGGFPLSVFAPPPQRKIHIHQVVDIPGVKL